MIQDFPVPQVFELTTHIDDRGDLTEIIHDHELPKFGQTYVVRNPTAFTIRGFHRHKVLVDYFTVVNGKAKVVCFAPESNPNGDPSSPPQPYEFILDSRIQSRLFIPVGWWHGWMSLEPNTIMICTGTEVHDRSNPDEERVPFDSFNYSWGVNFK
jgi:dTDP-4-dehydrorhamnose 3,5-epimerase-like enzyme